MSAKDVPKQGMDKKKSDARSQRHEDKSAQSISSLNTLPSYWSGFNSQLMHFIIQF
jgi:hypothetical protein